jgi:hypothetical protein
MRFFRGKTGIFQIFSGKILENIDIRKPTGYQSLLTIEI